MCFIDYSKKEVDFMKTLAEYLKIMSLTLLFLFVMQGCSFYMGFHVKSAPPSESRMTQGVTPNERETVKMVSNQDVQNDVR